MAPSRPRPQVPWRSAGRRAEGRGDSDSVVRETGWVFNNQRSRFLTLAEFVDSGEQEVGAYLEHFGFAHADNEQRTLVEIGAGIGRMTASFTQRFGSVIACDLDAAFLERCRETVAKFGRPERLSTVHTHDGRTMHIAERSADVTFSYITLQHCDASDALTLTTEAFRVLRPGGWVILNFRTWTPADVILFPAGIIMRVLWRLPIVGPWLVSKRWSTRLGWQANRLSPRVVLDHLRKSGVAVDDPSIWVRHARRRVEAPGVPIRTFAGIARSHWWLIARRGD
jgi:ubiquinone/menaquinone biosynthesis C-methylase UbiE